MQTWIINLRIIGLLGDRGKHATGGNSMAIMIILYCIVVSVTIYGQQFGLHCQFPHCGTIQAHLNALQTSIDGRIEAQMIETL